MNILLDTATLLWICCDPASLSPTAHAAYADLHNTLYVSVASLWEVIVKNRIGKLPLPLPIDQLIEPLKRSRAVRILPLTESAVLRLSGLPGVHRDPFDRMLACQAIDESLTILTPDALLKAYPVATLW
jgi:PIN domain nuclease of toxin-antitoxin system